MTSCVWLLSVSITASLLPAWRTTAQYPAWGPPPVIAFTVFLGDPAVTKVVKAIKEGGVIDVSFPLAPSDELAEHIDERER